MPGTSRASSASARGLPAGRGRRQHHRHADGAGARRSRGELQRRRWPAPTSPSPDGSSPAWRRRRSTCCVSPARTSTRRTVRRLADMRYIGQGSEITVALPQPLTEAGVKAAFETGLQGAVCAHAARRRHPVRGATSLRQRADARHRRHARTAAPSVGRRRARERGRCSSPMPARRCRPRSSTVTRWNRASRIDGPAVFEEDESTFIVGPGATARLLADGSILAEVG